MYMESNEKPIINRIKSGFGGTEKDKQMVARHSWKRMHNSFKMLYQ